MKTKIKLSSILPHFAASMQEALDASLKSAGLKPEDVELKRAGLSDDDMTLEEGSRSIIHRVSTRDVDRDGEVVIPSGVDLKDFMRNPVVMWGHNYKEPQIGSDEWIKVDDKGYALVAKTIYASTPRASEVWTLRKEGHLKTSSIGFVPTEVVRSNDAGFLKLVDQFTSDWPEFKKQRDRCAGFVKRAILLEHSDVPIPCNPNALTLAIAKSLNLSTEMVTALDIKAEDDPVIKVTPALAAQLMGIAPGEVTQAAFESWLKEKARKPTEHRQSPSGIKVLATPEQLAKGIKVLGIQGIKVLSEDTVRENLKNLLDLRLGKV